MDLETIFSIAGATAALGWAIMILAPRRWPALNAVPAIILPVGLSLLYSVLALIHLGPSEGGFATLADVRLLFASDEVLLTGWTHYLAFDLFVGAFMAGQMDRFGVHRILQAPILILIFMLGPLGYVLSMLSLGLQRLWKGVPA